MSISKSIKTWKSVAKPNHTIWFFQFVFAIIPSICMILTSIPNAKAITCLITHSFDDARKNLIISFLLSTLYALSWHVQYVLDNKQLLHIYPRIQKQIFDKLFTADESNFSFNSKEKMINTISNNIAELSDFCDFSSIKFACFVEFAVLICIIFSKNIIIGFIMTAVAILIFFILKLTNFLIAKTNIKILEGRDRLSENFSDIFDNRILSQDYNLKESLEKSYFEKVQTITKSYHSRTLLKSVRDNFVFLVHSLITFLATLFLLHLTKTDQINTITYLILVPYLSSSVEKIICFCNITKDVENASINAMRVKTLLSITSKDMIEFGNNSSTDMAKSITFSHVSYNSENKTNKTLGTINPFSAQISKNQTILFQGERNCGKRAIFYMLRRAIRPDTGTITFDIVNIYDFSQKTYTSLVSYVTNKPFFYAGTILQNFKLLNPSKKKIFEACKIAKIHDKITNLSNGYQTSFTMNGTNFSTFEKFQLSLARALLFDCEILLVYEFPTGMTKEESLVLLEIFKKLKKSKTIIMFSAQNLFKEILDRHFLVQNHTVSELATENNNQEKQKIIIDSKFSK